MQRRSLVLDSLANTYLHQSHMRRPSRLQPYRAQLQLLEQLDTYVPTGAWARTTSQWRDVPEDQLHWLTQALIEVLWPRHCIN